MCRVKLWNFNNFKIMNLFSKRLMKWREPKIKGMVTPKNILAALGLILVISIPFGFFGGNGKFNLWICFLAVGFMSAGLIGLVITPLLPGTIVRLTENAIVRGALGSTTRISPYQDIDCCYFYRNCSRAMENGVLVVMINQRSLERPNFTYFKIVMKSQSSNGLFRPVIDFSVSDEDDVSLDQVLQILRDKGVRIIEPTLSS
jgi:hypothetical protein